MMHEKDGLHPETSYVKNSFGAPTMGEWAWVAAKDLFPKMCSRLSKLEFSYNAKGRLQVKMFGAAKKLYNRKEHWLGADKSLPKEIRATLGVSKYEIEREQWGGGGGDKTKI